MGKASDPQPVKLVMPMFTGRTELFQRAQDALVDRYGPVDYVSATLPFAHTDYYEGEFGAELRRRFLAFEQLIDPGQLAEIKITTNALEAELSTGDRRSINLDPGYLSLAKLVLATTKNREHRIYLARGIYAEVTLSYRNKNFGAWPWTYPDYCSEAYLGIMRDIRALYKHQLDALRRRD